MQQVLDICYLLLIFITTTTTAVLACSVCYNQIPQTGWVQATDIPVTMSIKRIKCLGINLIKEVKDQYTKIIVMLCKKLKNI